MGPGLGRQDPGGPHVGPMNLAIWECSQFSPKSSQKTPNSLPIRMRCRVPFVYLNSDLYSASFTATLQAASCYIGLRYKGTRLYFYWISRMDHLSPFVWNFGGTLHLKSHATWLFVQQLTQVNHKGKIKSLHTGPLWWETTSDWCFPLRKGQ